MTSKDRCIFNLCMFAMIWKIENVFCTMAKHFILKISKSFQKPLL